jgi:large subunit ribosomal protein L23
MSKTLVLKPRLSEKSYGLSETRVYVVEVEKTANKHTVARAIKEQFEVEVKNVRIANVKGKTKQVRNLTGTKYRNSKGKRRDIKKAYVTLREGHSLPFFAAVEEEEAKEKAAQEKFDKAVAKQSAKETKDDKKPKRFGRNAKKDEEKK